MNRPKILEGDLIRIKNLFKTRECDKIVEPLFEVFIFSEKSENKLVFSYDDNILPIVLKPKIWGLAISFDLLTNKSTITLAFVEDYIDNIVEIYRKSGSDYKLIWEKIKKRSNYVRKTKNNIQI